MVDVIAVLELAIADARRNGAAITLCPESAEAVLGALKAGETWRELANNAEARLRVYQPQEPTYLHCADCGAEGDNPEGVTHTGACSLGDLAVEVRAGRTPIQQRAGDANGR